MIVRSELNVRPTVRSLIRACAATAIGAVDGIAPWRVAAREWSQDSTADWLTRGTSAIADMTSAPALVQAVMPDFVATLSPYSAAARIFREGLQLTFGRDGKISVPTIFGNPSCAAFVGEGLPIPVVQPPIEPLVTLTPKKITAIVVLTTEMIMSSNIEALMLYAVSRSIGIALDDALLDGEAGDNIRPAGVRYGVVPLTASAAPDPSAALTEDIENLFNDINDVATKAPLFVTRRGRAVTAELTSRHGLG